MRVGSGRNEHNERAGERSRNEGRGVYDRRNFTKRKLFSVERPHAQSVLYGVRFIILTIISCRITQPRKEKGFSSLSFLGGTASGIGT